MPLTRNRALAAILFLVSFTALAQSPSAASPSDQTRIRDYIGNGWNTLSRSMSECKSVADIKVYTTPLLRRPRRSMPCAQGARWMCAIYRA